MCPHLLGAFYIRYWAWRDCIAEAVSSCGIPESGAATHGGIFWAVPALFFTVLHARSEGS